MDQRDIVIRTVIGEAANEGPEGWAAVANVIKNRAADSRWPDQVGTVALQPKQFSAWNDGAGGNHLTHKYSRDDAIYQRVGAVVDAVMSGQTRDPTGGATHYYAPRGMEALVRQGAQSNVIPNWLAEESGRRGGQNVTIGGHIFTGLADGAPQPTAMVGSVSRPDTPQTIGGGFTREQIAAALEAGESAPQATLIAPETQAPQITPRQPAQIYKASADPLTAAMQAVKSHQERRKGLLTWL